MHDITLVLIEHIMSGTYITYYVLKEHIMGGICMTSHYVLIEHIMF